MPRTVNVKASADDPDFPFRKPLVVQANQDAASPGRLARHLLDRERAKGWTLTCKVPGHSQAGRNFAINAMARVEDEILELSGDYLVYGRTFEMSRDGGTTTEIRLGRPGVLDVD